MKSSIERTAVVLIGHGSKQKGFESAMKKVASELSGERRYQRVVCAYLEINHPSIPEAIELCVKAGCASIQLLPYFLLSGAHVKKDIPAIAVLAAKKYRGKAKIRLCPYLGFDKNIVTVVKRRLEEGKRWL